MWNKPYCSKVEAIWFLSRENMVETVCRATSFILVYFGPQTVHLVKSASLSFRVWWHIRL